ncbi:hypothetical protein [Streptomyces sp. NPDC056464]|uniref:hypothetical protein n=1 Tax=Streptomyces sp. NPDC056464 TaxID=3345828 RepID=UPI0036CD6D0C
MGLERRPAGAVLRALLAVTGDGGRDDPEWQPEYWKVELQVVFTEDPAWAELDSLGHQDTGYDFDEIGAARDAALVEIRRYIEFVARLPHMRQAGLIRLFMLAAASEQIDLYVSHFDIQAATRNGVEK